MKNRLKRLLVHCIAHATSLELEAVEDAIETPRNTEFGDLAFPCFLLSKSWKMPPQEIAKRLASEIPLPAGISEVIPTGPFLNFRFDRVHFVRGVIGDVLERGAPSLPENDFETQRFVGKTIVVEYSSPNIAKPFHVGHLRATLIGNSLDRVCRHIGCNTISINHLGDWGTQFGFVWAGCQLWGKPENADVLQLVDLYRRATGLKDAQEKEVVPPEEASLPNVNEIARSFFLDLERGEAYAVDFWKWCRELSLRYLERTYERLGVHFEHYIGESFYSDKLEAVRQELESAGILAESQGALGVELGEELGFARIYTPDGRSLYLTRDLATAEYRARTYNFDRALYVVGAPQSLHFQQLKGILKALKKDYADNVVHVAFGHVLGMKTRGEGEFIELNDFLDEAYERSLLAYHEQVSRRPEGTDETEVARAVALAAIIFSNLARTRLKDVHFVWEYALEFQGDSGPYLLYACARINSIREKAAEAGITLDTSFKAELIADEHAFQLASAIAEFPGALRRTFVDSDPCHLANFALDLAKAFSRAYNELKVVGEEPELAKARLALFESVRRTLSTTLTLLGITPLERM